MGATAQPVASGRPVKKATSVSIGVAIVFSIMWMAMGSQVSSRAKEKDFLNLYIGAQIAADSKFGVLHNKELQLNYERRQVPETRELWPFVRPHFYAALLAPLSWMPFNTAFLVWVGLQVALLLACWIWAAKRFGEEGLIFGSMYLPTAIGIANGQDCIFLLVVVVVAYRLAEQERDLLAGAVAALTLAKFHLVLLLPVAMWSAGRRRMVAGYGAAMAALVLISVALAGTAGVTAYMEMLTDPTLPALNPTPQKIISIHSVQWNLWGRMHLPVTLVLCTGISVLCWFASRRAPLWRWWTAGCLASLLVAPHVYVYDAAFFLLGIWLTMAYAQTRLAKALAAIVAPPLIFFVSFVQSEYAVMIAPAAALTALLVGIALEARSQAPQTARALRPQSAP